MVGSQATVSSDKPIADPKSIIDILPTEILVRALQILDPAKKEDRSALAKSLRVFKAVSPEILKHLYRRCETKALYAVRPNPVYGVILGPHTKYCRHLVVDSDFHNACGVDTVADTYPFQVELLEIDLSMVGSCLSTHVHERDKTYCPICEEEGPEDGCFFDSHLDYQHYWTELCEHCSSDLGHCLTPHLVGQLKPSTLIVDLDLIEYVWDESAYFEEWPYAAAKALSVALHSQHGFARTQTVILRLQGEFRCRGDGHGLGLGGMKGRLHRLTGGCLPVQVSSLVIMLDPYADLQSGYPFQIEEAINLILSLLNDTRQADNTVTNRRISLVGMSDAYASSLDYDDDDSADGITTPGLPESSLHPSDKDPMTTFKATSRQELDEHLLGLIRQRALGDLSWLTIRNLEPEKHKKAAEDLLDRLELIDFRGYAATLKGVEQGILTKEMLEYMAFMTRHEMKREGVKGQDAGSVDSASEIPA